MKLDTGILTSTLWVDRDGRETFITALLMAEPFEVAEPLKQIEVQTMDYTGWSVPPGWYGFVRAAGVGILRMAGVDREAGLAALERMGSPEPDSRSKDHEGRRLVRVDGGYIVLNYFKYRDRDYGAADRMRRLRARRKRDANSDASYANKANKAPRSPKHYASREQIAENELDGGAHAPAREGPRSNPLVVRSEAEADVHRLIREIAALLNLDPTEVLAKASTVAGTSMRSQMNVAAMSDDRLGHTRLRLREWHATLTGKAPTPGPLVEPVKPYVSPKAQARQDAANAFIRGGLKRDASSVGPGKQDPPRLPQGSGPDAGDARHPGRGVPGKPEPSDR